MPGPGRKSKAEQRRREILAAFERCICRHGLAESTVARVAEAAGIQRTLVFHYFGDRRALIDALIGYQVEAHERALQESLAGVAPGERLERVLDYFFGGRYYDDRFPEGAQVWMELVAIAGRDPHLRARLGTQWRRWLAEVEEELTEAYPGAPRERRAAIAYGLTCLFEQNFAMGLQGLGDARHAHARAAADALLETLR
jgi:AcrR family transcriptional regulator